MHWIECVTIQIEVQADVRSSLFITIMFDCVFHSKNVLSTLEECIATWKERVQRCFELADVTISANACSLSCTILKVPILQDPFKALFTDGV